MPLKRASLNQLLEVIYSLAFSSDLENDGKPVIVNVAGETRWLNKSFARKLVDGLSRMLVPTSFLSFSGYRHPQAVLEAQEIDPMSIEAYNAYAYAGDIVQARAGWSFWGPDMQEGETSPTKLAIPVRHDSKVIVTDGDFNQLASVEPWSSIFKLVDLHIYVDSSKAVVASAFEKTASAIGLVYNKKEITAIRENRDNGDYSILYDGF